MTSHCQAKTHATNETLQFFLQAETPENIDSGARVSSHVISSARGGIGAMEL
jgi:hypothetical protein